MRITIKSIKQAGAVVFRMVKPSGERVTAVGTLRLTQKVTSAEGVEFSIEFDGLIREPRKRKKRKKQRG